MPGTDCETSDRIQVQDVLPVGTYLRIPVLLPRNQSRRGPHYVDTCACGIYALIEWTYELRYPSSFTGEQCITNVLPSRLEANTRECGTDLYD
jgi:hypothetical protein